MKTVRQKAFAKVNLYLDVVGTSGGFHMLDSVVTTVSLYDEVIITSRKDDKIVLKTQGSIFSVSEGFDNNVYRAAEAFMKKFNVGGVDVTLHKFIPVSSGMGGSSADIVATLLGMKKLYGVEGADLKELADSLGSDAGYLLCGGYARIKGRGDIVERIDCDRKLYFVIACAKGGVNTAECYKRYDVLGDKQASVSADTFIERLKSGRLCQTDYHNALFKPAADINPEVMAVYEKMRSLSPDGVMMTGSGSGVFGVFATKELCAWAAEKMKSVTNDVFVCESVDPKSEKAGTFFSRNVYSLD